MKYFVIWDKMIDGEVEIKEFDTLGRAEEHIDKRLETDDYRELGYVVIKGRELQVLGYAYGPVRILENEG